MVQDFQILERKLVGTIREPGVPDTKIINFSDLSQFLSYFALLPHIIYIQITEVASSTHSSYNDNDNIANESVNDALFLSKKKKGPQTKSVSGTKCKWRYTCVTYYGRRYCYWKKVCTSSG